MDSLDFLWLKVKALLSNLRNSDLIGEVCYILPIRTVRYFDVRTYIILSRAEAREHAEIDSAMISQILVSLPIDCVFDLQPLVLTVKIISVEDNVTIHLNAMRCELNILIITVCCSGWFTRPHEGGDSLGE